MKRLATKLANLANLTADLAAERAQLIYVTDQAPGIRRRRCGKGFRYTNEQNRALTDPATLDRIRQLVIPPAWTNVWICHSPRGHLQCTGRDARGRKQYRYHSSWHRVRDESKYARLARFGTALPRIRRRVANDLKRPGLPRERVLALIVTLLETTLIRVGNEEYVRANRSFGLTTLRNKHARITGSMIRFCFRGKSGKFHEIGLNDRRLAQLVQRCRDLPGQELFQYIDDEQQTRSVGSADVNEYLREISGEEFSAKDFRTWAGTLLAATTLVRDQHSQGDKSIRLAVQAVAQRLGNTVAVSRKCYIHPAILEDFLDGSLTRELAVLSNQSLDAPGNRKAEAALLRYLNDHGSRYVERQAG